jgi:nicotinamide-nucleotide amidase
MEYLLEHAVLPYLRRRLSLTGLIKARLLRTAGLGESTLDQKIADLERLTNPTVGLAAHPGSVDVRITAKAASEAEADRMIAEVEAQVRSRLGETIFGADGDTVEGVLLDLAARRGQTLAAAEAGTEGAIAARLSAQRAHPAVFRGGFLAATPETLAEQFGLESGGAELGALAEAAARRAAAAQHADLGLACLIQYPDDGVQIGIGLAAVRGNAGLNDNLGFGGHVLLLPQWAATITLDRMRRWLLADSGRIPA